MSLDYYINLSNYEEFINELNVVHSTESDKQVSKKQEKNWKFRLECLRIQVEYWIKNKSEKTIEVVQLFYDSK